MEEFRLSQGAYEAVRKLLREHTGINIGPQKQAMVRARLTKRLRALGIRDFDSYLRCVEGPGSEEWDPFVNALTTNLTSFFRERHHFEFLGAHFSSHPPPNRRLRVWSAGCSTGEEPYSIAMVLKGQFPDWDIHIVATDVDTNVLEVGRSGVYPIERTESMPSEWVRFAFQRGVGAHAGQVKIRPSIRACVEFRVLNLLGSGGWPRPESFEVVFCRNVMIYFDKPTQRSLLTRFRDVLVPGGFLMVGHSEALLDPNLGLENLGGTIYRRREP